jgi:hypothetical protein
VIFDFCLVCFDPGERVALPGVEVSFLAVAFQT